MHPQLNELKAVCVEFFDKLGASAELNLQLTDDSLLKVQARATKPKLLIGQRGQTLLEIQHLLRLLTRKLLPPSAHLELDINEYKQKKISYLHELALELAQEVAQSKCEKELPPMPAFERRAIHAAITDNPAVLTESIGMGETRRVVIKPAPTPPRFPQPKI